MEPTESTKIIPRTNETHPQKQREIEITLNTLNALFPEKKFATFSTEGTSCTFFIEVGTDTLYKVGINKMELYLNQDPRVISGQIQIPNSEELLSYFTRETSVAKLLANINAAPKLFGFISPNMSTDEETEIKNLFGISDTELAAYKALKAPLPIIIMERINPNQNPGEFNQALSEIDNEILVSEIDRLTQILEKLHLFPRDTEIVWDIKNQRLIFLDTGAIRDEPLMNTNGGFLTAREHILRLLPLKIRQRIN